MTEEDKKALAAEVADELQDSCDLDTEAGRELAAGCVVDRMESWFRQQGWIPPETSDRIRDWAMRTGKLPQDPGPGVLTSHLAELAAILNGS